MTVTGVIELLLFCIEPARAHEALKAAVRMWAVFMTITKPRIVERIRRLWSKLIPDDADND